MRCLTLVAAALLLLGICRPADLRGQSTSQNLSARIDSLVVASLQQDKTPGITIAVVRGGDTIALKGYGFADVENQVPATASSVFHIASLTKQFTAAAILRLVEQGKVRVDATVANYLPDYQGPARCVTIHQLLTHTAGVRNYTEIKSLAEQSRLDLTHQQMLDVWARDSLVFEPGTKWAYSNSGYYLLGLIIEKVSGMTYEQHLRQTFWEPLGLSQTYYCAQRPIIPHRAQSYGVKDGSLFNAPPLSINIPFSAGGLCSTPRDLVRWTHSLHAGKVVSRESLTSMTTGVRLSDGSVHPYGYGLTPGTLGDVATIQHGGGINGFSAHLAHYPARDVTIAVIANGPGSTSTLAQRIAYMVLDIPDPANVDLATTREQRARYTGVYQEGESTSERFRVFEQDGRLYIQLSGQSPLPLRHQGSDTFDGPPSSKVRVTFIEESGRITGFTIPGAGLKARKVD